MVRRILVTGMSGTGKSSALDRLRRLGFRTVDTDEGDWTDWSEAESGYVWREERIAELLADDEGASLYVSGTVSNQGCFYDRFDAGTRTPPSGRGRAASAWVVHSRNRRYPAAR
jgi:broad-specificity NMP kinase